MEGVLLPAKIRLRMQPWNKQRVSRVATPKANFAGGNAPSRIIVQYALCIMHNAL